MQDYEAMWELAGSRVSAMVGQASAVAVLGDDPAATGAVSLGVARAFARTRRVFLLDLLGDAQGLDGLREALRARARAREGDDERYGVSDMVLYGVSLGRAAHARGDQPNLYFVPGGAESPLNDDILAHRWWSVVAEQVRRANALLVVAAPSMVPGIAAMVKQLDGVILVGDAQAPASDTRVIAEARLEVARRSPVSGVRAVPGTREAAKAPTSPSRRLTIAALTVVTLLAAGAALTSSWWRPFIGRVAGAPAAEQPVGTDAPDAFAAQVTPPPPSELVAIGGANYSVELLFTNSEQDAFAYIARAADSLPATTYSIVAMGTDSTDRWYRVLSGAFADSSLADAFLATLRTSGRLTTGAASITRTPYALVLDSATSGNMARLRVTAYHGRGIPAYALRDSTPVWRIYAGAFPIAAEAQLLARQLDSLNIHSALVVRAGSTP